MGDTVKQTITQVSSHPPRTQYTCVQLFYINEASSQIMLDSTTDFQHKHFTQTLLYV